MAGEDKVLKVLLQIQSDLQGITSLRGAVEDLKKGLDDTGKSAFSWGDAFKFSGAQEALRGVLEGVKKVGEEVVGFLEASVEKAAELQTEAFPLTALIGNAAVAKEVLTGLDSAWQEFGVVSNQALADASRGLLLLGTNTENLLPRLTEITKISLAAGVSLQDVVSAYSRFQTAIINETEVFTRGMGGFGAATIALLDVLQDHFGKTRDEIQTMLKTGQISLNDLNQAMRGSAEAGGRFADVIEQKKNTFDGAVQAMKTAWQEFEVEIGKPIIDALTPVIREVTQIGQAFAKLAEETSWQDAIKLAWIMLLGKIEEITVTELIQLFTNIGPAAADAFFEGYVERLKKIFTGQVLKDALTGDVGKALMEAMMPVDLDKMGQVIMDRLLSGLKAKFPELKEEFDKILESIHSSSGGDILPPETPEKLGQVAKTGRDLAAAMKELEAALQAVHQQQQLINKDPFLVADQKQQLLISSITQEIATLEAEMAKLEKMKPEAFGDPNKLAEINQKYQEADAKVKLLREDLAGLTQPLRAELTTWVNAWGSAAVQIGHAIEGTIGAALQSVNQFLATGKFNAQQLLQTITTLGLELIEHLILQRVMAAINSGEAVAQAQSTAPLIAAAWAPAATAASVATEGEADVQAPVAFGIALAAIQGMMVLHEGGRVSRMHSGGLAPDEQMIIAQEGEFMIRREVAQHIMPYLFALNDGEFFHTGGAIRRLHGGGDDFYPPGEMFGDPIPPFAEPTPLPSPSPTPYDPWAGPSGPLTGGPQVTVFSDPSGGGPTGEWGGIDPGDLIGASDLGPTNFGSWFGFSPPIGTPGFLQGPTMLPTTFDAQGYPFAALYNPTDPVGLEHLGQQLHPHHSGGPIGRFHLGGSIGRFPRFHSGGSLGGGVSAGGRAAIHIHNYTDLKTLVKEMASHKGRNIIIDTVRGRRIDLGI